MSNKNDAAATATPLTEGQIAKMNQNLTAKFLKHKNEISSDVFQQILGDKTFFNDVWKSAIDRARAITNVLTINMGPVKPAGSKTVKDAVKNGHYTDHYSYLEDEKNAKIMANWPKDLPEREIFIGLVPSGEVVPKGGVQEYWAQRGYQIPQHADVYLHQLMCNVPEEKMPAELKDKYLVAYTDTPNFRDGFGRGCRLAVNRDDSRRKLDLTFERGDWSGGWGFMLCKKTSETEA
jgi:hypothetical protein